MLLCQPWTSCLICSRYRVDILHWNIATYTPFCPGGSARNPSCDFSHYRVRNKTSSLYFDRLRRGKKYLSMYKNDLEKLQSQCLEISDLRIDQNIFLENDHGIELRLSLQRFLLPRPPAVDTLMSEIPFSSPAK